MPHEAHVLTIAHPQVEEYLFRLASQYDEPVLCSMEEYGRQNRFPIIDRLVGKMVHTWALSIQAKTVFEMGSGFGYSAYWFGKAVGEQGSVICTDGDQKNKDLAQKFLTQAGLWSRVQFKIGDAVEILATIPGTFDIIYNDIDKKDYPQAWKIACSRIRSGGLYIADNTLWGGRVAEHGPIEDIRPGWTEAIRDHNREIFTDKEFDVTLLPLRDGVLIARKK